MPWTMQTRAWNKSRITGSGAQRAPLPFNEQEFDGVLAPPPTLAIKRVATRDSARSCLRNEPTLARRFAALQT